MGDTKGTFCFGDQISMADVFLLPFVANAIKHNIDVEQQFPKINQVKVSLDKNQQFTDIF